AGREAAAGDGDGGAAVDRPAAGGDRVHLDRVDVGEAAGEHVLAAGDAHVHVDRPRRCARGQGRLDDVGGERGGVLGEAAAEAEREVAPVEVGADKHHTRAAGDGAGGGGEGAEAHLGLRRIEVAVGLEGAAARRAQLD